MNGINFTFTYVLKNGDTEIKRITFDTKEVTLYEVLKDFADFLSGCGFSLPKKDYPIIVDEEEEE